MIGMGGGGRRASSEVFTMQNDMLPCSLLPIIKNFFSITLLLCLVINFLVIKVGNNERCWTLKWILKIQLSIYLYKVVISVWLSGSWSDHNSGTPWQIF